ncbi:MAG TPA: hypothetical protein VHM30_08155 [Gemmatimonadaceae bacterium]|nr:hypothetical protein [Gemmatimonadaceae bacterium]
MGCLRRVGCLVVVVAIAIGLWITQDRWMHLVRRGSGRSDRVAPTAERVWQPLSPQAAARGKRAIDGLSSARGPVYANLSPDEIASYVVQAAGGAFPAGTDSVEAAVIGDVLYVRAIVPTKEIARSGVLGPLAGLLNDRERVSLGGGFRVVRPGLSEFRLRDVKLREFSVPRGAIPRLVNQITKGKKTPGIADDALAVPTPPSLADVRIGDGRVTLYKTTPPGTAP